MSRERSSTNAIVPQSVEVADADFVAHAQAEKLKQIFQQNRSLFKLASSNNMSRQATFEKAEKTLTNDSGAGVGGCPVDRQDAIDIQPVMTPAKAVLTNKILKDISKFIINTQNSKTVTGPFVDWLLTKYNEGYQLLGSSLNLYVEQWPSRLQQYGKTSLTLLADDLLRERIGYALVLNDLFDNIISGALDDQLKLLLIYNSRGLLNELQAQLVEQPDKAATVVEKLRNTKTQLGYRLKLEKHIQSKIVALVHHINSLDDQAPTTVINKLLRLFYFNKRPSGNEGSTFLALLGGNKFADFLVNVGISDEQLAQIVPAVQCTHPTRSYQRWGKAVMIHSMKYDFYRLIQTAFPGVNVPTTTAQLIEREIAKSRREITQQTFLFPRLQQNIAYGCAIGGLTSFIVGMLVLTIISIKTGRVDLIYFATLLELIAAGIDVICVVSLYNRKNPIITADTLIDDEAFAGVVAQLGFNVPSDDTIPLSHGTELNDSAGSIVIPSTNNVQHGSGERYSASDSSAEGCDLSLTLGTSMRGRVLACRRNELDEALGSAGVGPAPSAARLDRGENSGAAMHESYSYESPSASSARSTRSCDNSSSDGTVALSVVEAHDGATNPKAVTSHVSEIFYRRRSGPLSDIIEASDSGRDYGTEPDNGSDCPSSTSTLT